MSRVRWGTSPAWRRLTTTGSLSTKRKLSIGALVRPARRRRSDGQRKELNDQPHEQESIHHEERRRGRNNYFCPRAHVRGKVPGHGSSSGREWFEGKSALVARTAEPAATWKELTVDRSHGRRV